MIYSIVDLGSNTIRLCVYDFRNKKLKPLFKSKIVAGLANYVVNDKLSGKGIVKACEALIQFQDIMRNLSIEPKETRVFATASLRNIVNAEEVIREILDKTGLQVELLSGEEEARLGFIGASTYYELIDGVLIDIGGGSTEIVVFSNKQIEFATSVPIGSLNLYVKYANKIIPSQNERATMKQVVMNHLTSLQARLKPCNIIYGVGGTIRAASKLYNAIYGLPSTHRSIPASHITSMLNQLNSSKKKTLLPVTQTIPDRIHTIIPGMIILDTIAQHLNCERIMISPYALREGYMFGRMLKDADGSC